MWSDVGDHIYLPSNPPDRRSRKAIPSLSKPAYRDPFLTKPINLTEQQSSPRQQLVEKESSRKSFEDHVARATVQVFTGTGRDGVERGYGLRCHSQAWFAETPIVVAKSRQVIIVKLRERLKKIPFKSRTLSFDTITRIGIGCMPHRRSVKVSADRAYFREINLDRMLEMGKTLRARSDDVRSYFGEHVRHKLPS